ncbi:hypothetical protein N7478_010736 [Penicillium angulare]|uniref:uncharacterized protein n=1 Tax=Penicillium angulare TaxID=116970 RepID=UPI0025418D9C|nr:uncharacterized protein N7478_010151 [Penicillium angulare]XP_056776320.1 uncharacterized protein N7478_010736 [Penicillium angulare]KAJ5267343.1 hypothetical protein N7478_010151 [Penicillium angulare]KAJ5267928.1 hypothetical protein N7478_010736 [Penicillium angulare]
MLQHNPLQETYAVGDAPWSLTILSIGMCVGWLANYIAMIRKSFQDRTYGMALMPLCCNIACEFVYGVIYPPDIPIWPYIFASWLALNFLVVYAAMKFAPNEWSHAPLVEQNLPCIFAVSIAMWMSAHLTLVAHVGQSAAAAWSSWFCQLLLSAGGLCQLIVRGSTRGTSLFIWYVFIPEGHYLFCLMADLSGIPGPVDSSGLSLPCHMRFCGTDMDTQMSFGIVR